MKIFGVVRIADVWTILVEGRRWGRYQYRVDAEESALRLAAAAIAEGREASVLVQESGGEMVSLSVAGAVRRPAFSSAC
jgi:hypothetical protein